MHPLQLLLPLALTLTTGKVSYKGHQVYSILVKDKSQAELLKSLDEENVFDFWNGITEGKHVDVRTSPENAEALNKWIKAKGMDNFIMIKDVGELIDLEEKADMEFGQGMDWTNYHSLEDIYDWFNNLEAKFDYCQQEVIGQSHEGQDMVVMKVCRGGCGNKPAMWIDSGIHAREWISPAVGTYMLNELLENDHQHPELTQNLDWYFLPSHNPDGYRKTRTEDRMWRKTTSSYPGNKCQGTDPNRNWDFHWGEPATATSNSSCSHSYAGPEPFSEVETRNARDFIFKHKDNIKYYQTLHSFSQLILMPWGHTETPPPRFTQMMDLANRGNEALYLKHNQTYKVGCIACILYQVSGDSTSWAHGVAGIPYAYSIELRPIDESVGFLLSPDQIIPTGEEVWAFHEIAAQQIISEYGS